MVGGGGDDDGVERGLFLPTEIAVTVADAAFGETGLFQAAERFLIKRPDDLDGVNVGRDFEENSGLVAAAGADLEDFLAGFDLEQFGHQRDDVRLADRLAVADRQRLIVVGLPSQVRFHKLVPRHPAHGLEHHRVRHAPGADLFFDHAVPLAVRLRVLGGRRGQDHQQRGEGSRKSAPAARGGAGRGVGWTTGLHFPDAEPIKGIRICGEACTFGQARQRRAGS